MPRQSSTQHILCAEHIVSLCTGKNVKVQKIINFKNLTFWLLNLFANREYSDLGGVSISTSKRLKFKEHKISITISLSISLDFLLYSYALL